MRRRGVKNESAGEGTKTPQFSEEESGTAAKSDDPIPGIALYPTRNVGAGKIELRKGGGLLKEKHKNKVCRFQRVPHPWVLEWTEAGGRLLSP